MPVAPLLPDPELVSEEGRIIDPYGDSIGTRTGPCFGNLTTSYPGDIPFCVGKPACSKN